MVWLRERDSSRKRSGIELADAFIAATAVLNNAELVTRNEKHYPMTDVAVLVPYQRGQ
jgi:predicted nucleic acid-binding protein